MALAKTHAISLLGLAGTVVEVEVEISSNLPSFVLVGLPDASLLEAKDRVRSAISNSALKFPGQRVTVNLSPASVPKHGSSFDLAIAVAIALASRQLRTSDLADTIFIGELALDGRLRPVRAALPTVLAAKKAGFRRVIVPSRNLAEALLVNDIEVLGFHSFADLVAGRACDEIEALPNDSTASHHEDLDLADVRGQEVAVEGLSIAAAGGHHMLLIGSPGAGKTMLARRLPTILPLLSHEQATESLALHSLAGRAVEGFADLASMGSARPPFEAPHHSATEVALIGGGQSMPRPGLISLAHNGVLFLDEATEFSAKTLDAMRQPLESGEVSIHRAVGTAKFPARFQLVMAANPCPCGFRLSTKSRCTCSHSVASKYLGRLSGPLLDRIDLRLVIQPANRISAKPKEAVATSAEIRAKVANARSLAAKRLHDTNWQLNAQVSGPYLRSNLALDSKARKRLESQVDAGQLSMRGLDRCLRIAWTIADLNDSGQPSAEDVDLALIFRGQGNFDAGL